MDTSFVLPKACKGIFFPDDGPLQNRTIWASDLKQGVTNKTYYYSPEGYGAVYMSMFAQNKTRHAPAYALELLAHQLNAACSYPITAPHSHPNWQGWIPSFENKEFQVSSIIESSSSRGFISLIDRKKGYLSNNTFTAYPGCIYKTNDPKIRMNGTSITPVNLTEVRPVAFNASIEGFADFEEGYTAEYSVVLAPGGPSVSPKYTMKVSASNLTASMDLRKEAWHCFQKVYAFYMATDDPKTFECIKWKEKPLPNGGWIIHWPCYTGNQRNDTQGQYCYCETFLEPQTGSAARAKSSAVIGFLSLLMLYILV
ncbi:hypothetical protein HDU80_002710 [Chytriomyces hyalinus]|nr:hypothetical protein HDU80_002710 [Chytriomyces hyalinus]